MKPPAKTSIVLFVGVSVSMFITFVVFFSSRPEPIFFEKHQSIELEGCGSNPSVFSIEVPESATYSRSDGVDFIVHRITFPGRVGMIGVYVGRNPKRFLDDPQIVEDGSVGDHEIQWARGSIESEIIAETVIPMFLNPGPRDRGSFLIDLDSIHMWAFTSKKKNLEPLVNLCETLTLIKPRTPN